MASIDVDKVRFTPVHMRRGYDMSEVDDHLDLVKQTLDALDAAVAHGGPLPGVLPSPRFTPVQLRTGYDMGEVDAFLDDVSAEEARLRGLAGRGITPAVSPVTDPVVDPSAPDEVVDVSAPQRVTDVSAPPMPAPGEYPAVIRKSSSGRGVALFAGLVLLALVLAVVLL